MTLTETKPEEIQNPEFTHAKPMADFISEMRNKKYAFAELDHNLIIMPSRVALPDCGYEVVNGDENYLTVTLQYVVETESWFVMNQVKIRKNDESVHEYSTKFNTAIMESIKDSFEKDIPTLDEEGQIKVIYKVVPDDIPVFAQSEDDTMTSMVQMFQLLATTEFMFDTIEKLGDFPQPEIQDGSKLSSEEWEKVTADAHKTEKIDISGETAVVESTEIH